MGSSSSPSAFFLLLSVVLFIKLLSPALVLSKAVDSQSFILLENLQGCQKGQSAKGVQQIKQYLKEFGYLTYQNHDAHANNEEFDSVLESAVKTYQLNYNLNVTGTIDSQTLKTIMTPRCGVADIIGGSTRMRSGGSNNKQSMRHRDRKTLNTVSHFTFFTETNPPKWPATQTAFKYAFSSTSPRALDVGTLRPIISRAFASWAAVTRFTFEETNDPSNADIVIGFHSGEHGDNRPFDGSGTFDSDRGSFVNVLAHAFQPTIGLLHFDADENWGTINQSPSLVDLQTVAVHEIGHVLGLGHSSDQDAVMYASISYGEIKRDLARDDIQGIRTLYDLPI